ncbi:MAG: CcmD family protein [Planctomycetota bacterium]
MGTFVTAYLVVWLAVLFYVVRLGACQRRLERSLKALESQFDEPGTSQEPTSKAA